MLNQKWLINIDIPRANEIIEIHQNYFKFDGGVSWALPYEKPSGGEYAVKVHVDVANQLSDVERTNLINALPSEWLPVFELP